jgi:hypothetical protein
MEAEESCPEAEGGGEHPRQDESDFAQSLAEGRTIKRCGWGGRASRFGSCRASSIEE